DAAAVAVAVLKRPAVPLRDADAQTEVGAEGNDVCPVLTCHLGRPVRRAVVDDQYVDVGKLLAQVVEDRGEVLLLVPGRYEDDRVSHASSGRPPTARRAAAAARTAARQAPRRERPAATGQGRRGSGPRHRAFRRAGRRTAACGEDGTARRR